MNGKIGFVGGGNISRALVGGLLESGYDAQEILISEPNAAARELLTQQLPGVLISSSNTVVGEAASCIVLAVKPQILAHVCHELRPIVQDSKPLIISIAAGVRSDDIDTWLGGGLSIVRAMPNTAAVLRLAVSGLFANDRVDGAERKRAAEVIAAIGSIVHVDSESDMDAVTAVSGTGPAYFFLLIDILRKTAIDLGLNAVIAETLAVETAKGAAMLAGAESESMETLIERVRSPGGTTAAAFDSLEADQVRVIFARAITAARDRAVELADDAHVSQK